MSIYRNLSDIYVSSDIRSNPAGGIWLETTIGALKKADIHIAICSKNSMQKPWIHIEAGFPFVMKKPIICIYHSGLSSDQASSPYSSFQGLDTDHENFASDFFNSLGKYIGHQTLPPDELKSFTQEVLTTIDSLNKANLNDANLKVASNSENFEIEEIEKLILSTFSSLGDKKLTIEQIAIYVNEHYEYKRHKTEIKYYLTELVNRKYLDFHPNIELPPKYSLRHKGREYLVKNGLLYYEIVR